MSLPALQQFRAAYTLAPPAPSTPPLAKCLVLREMGTVAVQDKVAPPPCPRPRASPPPSRRQGNLALPSIPPKISLMGQSAGDEDCRVARRLLSTPVQPMARSGLAGCGVPAGVPYHDRA